MEDNENNQDEIKEVDEEEFEEFIEDFRDKGMGCGEKIAKVLEDRGKERVISLYRSALIIDKSDNGIRMDCWGDPHVNGEEEINDETVSDDPDHEYLLTGTRNGGRVYVYEYASEQWSEMFPLSTAKFLIDRDEDEEDDETVQED